MVCRAPPPREGIVPGTSAWVLGPQTDPAEPSDLRSQAGSPVTQSGQVRMVGGRRVAQGVQLGAGRGGAGDKGQSGRKGSGPGACGSFQKNGGAF